MWAFWLIKEAYRQLEVDEGTWGAWENGQINTSRVTGARCGNLFVRVWRNNFSGIKYEVLQIQRHGLPAAATCVAGYSGRISKCSRRWARRSAFSASAGLDAQAKMNPR